MFTVDYERDTPTLTRIVVNLRVININALFSIINFDNELFEEVIAQQAVNHSSFGGRYRRTEGYHGNVLLQEFETRQAQRNACSDSACNSAFASPTLFRTATQRDTECFCAPCVHHVERCAIV